MLDKSELLWIIFGVTVSLIVFLCFCFGCLIFCAAIFGDEEKDDKNEETTQKSSKKVEFSSSEVGWSVPCQSPSMYPPANSGPPYPPPSSTPYPPIGLSSPLPYPILNPQVTAPYPAGNSRTPSPQPYLPYPVQSVNESKKVNEGSDIIKPSARGSV